MDNETFFSKLAPDQQKKVENYVNAIFSLNKEHGSLEKHLRRLKVEDISKRLWEKNSG